jgi:hypothetical protein
VTLLCTDSARPLIHAAMCLLRTYLGGDQVVIAEFRTLGGVPPLVDLMAHADLEVASLAASVAGECAAVDDLCIEEIVQCRGIKLLLRLLSAKDRDSLVAAPFAIGTTSALTSVPVSVTEHWFFVFGKVTALGLRWWRSGSVQPVA